MSFLNGLILYNFITKKHGKKIFCLWYIYNLNQPFFPLKVVIVDFKMLLWCKASSSLPRFNYYFLPKRGKKWRLILSARFLTVLSVLLCCWPWNEYLRMWYRQVIVFDFLWRHWWAFATFTHMIYRDTKTHRETRCIRSQNSNLEFIYLL